MIENDFERSLAKIGGSELVDRFQARVVSNPAKPLPTAELDGFSIGYAMVIGGLASAVDIILDKAFREEMAEKHQKLDAKARMELEKKVAKRLDELGLNTEKGQEGMAMDWYDKLNEALGLKPPFRLRPANHRILNHTDERTVIEMLMNGEAGIGDLVYKIFPQMSREAATELLKMHLDADRASPASLPLKLMSWLWEQGIKAGDPAKVGEPSVLFKMFEGATKNLDWSKWLNKFFGEGLVPEGATIGEAMLKLYDCKAINQRVFWTSDFGAAFGGAKRRMIIAAIMELGIEVFAFLEGIKKGHIQWKGGLTQMASQVKAWRDQPKYLDMKIMAQAFAVSGGAVRAGMTGDVLQINFFSFGLMFKHLCVYPATERRHFARLVEFSRNDTNEIIRGFRSRTGIAPRPTLTVIDGGKTMSASLEDRLIKAGCQSTRICVLSIDHPDEFAEITKRYEALSKKASGNAEKEEAFDRICESWYLADEDDDHKAIAKLRKDLEKVEKRVA